MSRGRSHGINSEAGKKQCRGDTGEAQDFNPGHQRGTSCLCSGRPWLRGKGRNEADFHPAIQRGGDPFQRRQRVPVIIAVFQARDCGLRHPGNLSKLRLGQPGGSAGVIDRLCGLRFAPLLGANPLLVWVAAKLQVHDLNGIAGGVRHRALSQRSEGVVNGAWEGESVGMDSYAVGRSAEWPPSRAKI